MIIGGVKKCVEAVRERYTKSSCREKGRILDENKKLPFREHSGILTEVFGRLRGALAQVVLS